MNLERQFVPESNGNIAGGFIQGIYSVKPEEDIMVTLSNGLSFKHIPKNDRRKYQLAVAERLRELGLESAKICHTNSVPVMSIFSDWKQLESCYNEKKNLGDEFKNEMSRIAASIGYTLKGETTEDIFKELRNILRYKDPKFLAARFAAMCKDRSNLGQSSFFRLVVAGRGYIKAVEKISFLKEHFEAKPDEFLSVIIFGRAPWTEKLVSRRYKVQFYWARNFISGIHNKFRSALKVQGIKIPKIENLSKTRIIEACKDLESEINEQINHMINEGIDTTRINKFLNFVIKIKDNPSLLLDMFKAKDFNLSWKSLKNYANSIRGVSFSAFRAVIIRACIQQDVWKHVLEGCYRLFTPENTLKRPFSERMPLHPQPIDLIMGRKYVIYRPGNANRMTEILKSDHELWFEIPNVFIDGNRKTVKVRWVAQKAIYEALELGAKIKMFRFNMPRGPGKTIKVDVILKGNEVHFIKKKHLKTPPLQNKAIKNSFSGIMQKEGVMGFDINRLSEYVITAPIKLYIEEIIEKELRRWKDLEDKISHLQSKSDRVKDWRKRHKLRSHKRLNQKRRSNLRIASFKKARLHLGRVIKALKLKFLGVEAELGRDTKDTRGALAKAISSMPDNVSLISREILAVNLAENLDIKLVIVKKEGTTKFHYKCGGIIEKSGDFGKCKKCGKIFIHHNNSACNITDRTIKIVNDYLNSKK